MMAFRRLNVLFLAAAVASVKELENIPPASCESYGLPIEDYETYHGDKVCNRADYEAFKSGFRRDLKYRELMNSQGINTVPNQKTVVCPLEVQDLKEGPQQGVGFDTTWIVENTSSDPIVLSFLKDGVEYSAMNTKITPPHNDPEAILAPRQWKSVAAFEGHVFHARTLDVKSNTLGPVVLQHRTGLVPIGAKFQDLDCPDTDPEPIIPETLEREPAFARTEPELNRPCNTIDIGFRNMANCPLHGYFLESSEGTCQEHFKFHLGMNRVPGDFMWDWDSATKFEGSFVGHTFAFRSAANPSILVEKVTLQPTRVIDCPELKEKTQINTVSSVGDLVSIITPVSDLHEIRKEYPFEDSNMRVNPYLLASFFNETGLSENATSSSEGRKSIKRWRLMDAAPLVGIRSF